MRGIPGVRVCPYPLMGNVRTSDTSSPLEDGAAGLTNGKNSATVESLSERSVYDV